MEELEKHTVSCRLTSWENLHLTLAFLGEVRCPDKACRALDQIEADAFSLKVCGWGKFPREGGDLYWAGVNRSKPLEQVHRKLTQSLLAQGFSLEDRPFHPHLTLARQVRENPNFPFDLPHRQLGPFEMKVPGISLMKSERKQGRMEYTELYQKPLLLRE